MDDLIIVVFASATKSTTHHSITSAHTMVLENLTATPSERSDCAKASRESLPITVLKAVLKAQSRDIISLMIVIVCQAN